MTLDELDKKWERDQALAALAAEALAQAAADGITADVQPDATDDLINACILLEEVGKWFDLLLDKGVVGKPLSRKTRKEMQQLSDGIAEYLQGVEAGMEAEVNNLGGEI